MHLIGFNGLKSSGKNTAYEFLASIAANYGETAMERGFADKLKVLGALTLGLEGPDQNMIDHMNFFKNSGLIDVTMLDDVTGDHWTITGRQYLQNLGNQGRYVFGDDFWVDQVLPLDRFSLRRLWQENSAVVDWAGVTDLRYPNEAERVRDLGGIVVEIIRPGVESDGHVTEQPLPPTLVNCTIANDGTKLELRDKIGTMMAKLDASGQAKVNL